MTTSATARPRCSPPSTSSTAPSSAAACSAHEVLGEAPPKSLSCAALTLTDSLEPAGTGWAHSRVGKVQEQHGRRPRLLGKNGSTVQHHAPASVQLAPAAPPSVSLPDVHAGLASAHGWS